MSIYFGLIRPCNNKPNHKFDYITAICETTADKNPMPVQKTNEELYGLKGGYTKEMLNVINNITDSTCKEAVMTPGLAPLTWCKQ